jgi:hypothetical protein
MDLGILNAKRHTREASAFAGAIWDLAGMA